MHCYATIFLLLVAATPSAEAAPVALPNGTALREVSFERRVAPLLGRYGCNAGACHGSFQGKGGLRFSLFGYSAEMDYSALTRDALARRLDLAQPERSLLLLKPTTRTPHQGGLRFSEGSWPYHVIRTWISQGAKQRRGHGILKRLDVHPHELRFAGPGEAVALRIIAEFADGSCEDVTPFCAFRPRDDSIVETAADGLVRGLHPGDTDAVISYGGNLTTVHILVPYSASPGFVYPNVPETNFIDREVFTKLRNLNIVPSDAASDAEFLRRLTLDTIGTLPTPQVVRDFLADTRPEKRAHKIDELLAHPLHAALWATKLCDITANNLEVMEEPSELGSKRAKMWHDWFRKRIADNMPSDRIVRGVLTATSREGKSVQQWIDRGVRLREQLRHGFQTDYAEREGLDFFGDG